MVGCSSSNDVENDTNGLTAYLQESIEYYDRVIIEKETLSEKEQKTYNDSFRSFQPELESMFENMLSEEEKDVIRRLAAPKGPEAYEQAREEAIEMFSLDD